MSITAIASAGPAWQGFGCKWVQLVFWSIQQVLRSLLPLALACVAWTLPVLAGRDFDITPPRRALLNTIRFAEGTWSQGKNGYKVLFGGSLFHDLSRHPNKTIHRWPYSSAAAGAYQFLPTTWRMAKKALQLRNFQPDSQDQAALYLIQRRKALGLADRGQFTRELAHRLAPEWSSFPTHSGKSYHGQPVRSFLSLQRFYNEDLAARVRREHPVLVAAGPPPPLSDQPLPALATKNNHSRRHPTPTRLIPAATSAACDVICLLDSVAYGGAPIYPEAPEAIVSQS